MKHTILAGAAAGAAGTTALNAVTYLDMALRGRGSSSVPQDLVERLSDTAHLPIPGEDEQHANRVAGLGPLLGIGMGVGIGALLGAVRARSRPGLPATAVTTGLAAMAGSDLPTAALGISDPRQWRPADWLSDLVPHLVYGAVTAAAYEVLVDGGRRRRSRRR